MEKNIKKATPFILGVENIAILFFFKVLNIKGQNKELKKRHNPNNTENL